jgi:predicted MFS family arabinose efflux permease
MSIAVVGSRRLGQKGSVVMLALATTSIMAAASAPSPIYPLYRDRWHFSVTMLTVIFAVYVVGLLGALLTVGSLSDHVGRRPVLVAAFVIAAASTVTFSTAGGPTALLVARLVQGVASGTAMSVLAAALVDNASRSRPHLATTVTAVSTSVGMALGGAFVGLLTQWTTHPDLVVFPLLTAVFVALAVASWVLPEPRPVPAGRRLTLRPRVRVSAEARSEFWAAAPTTVAGWAATGLFLALMPSLVRDELQLRFAAAGGLTIAALYVAVTAGGLWSVRLRARTANTRGAALMAVGAVNLAAALAATSSVEFGVGAVAVGLGVGLTFNGNLRSIGAVTSAGSRSETFAAVYVLSYASLSVPTLIAGVAAPTFGLKTTSYAFIAFLALLSAAAGIHGARRVSRGTAASSVEDAASSERTAPDREAARRTVVATGGARTLSRPGSARCPQR